MTKEEEIFNERLAIRDDQIVTLKEHIDSLSDKIDSLNDHLKKTQTVITAAHGYLVAKVGEHNKRRRDMALSLRNYQEYLEGRTSINPESLPIRIDN